MKPEKCSIADFMNMIKYVATIDSKNCHVVQLIVRNAAKNSTTVDGMLNRYGIAHTKNARGFVVYRSYKMSAPATRLMDSVCRRHSGMTVSKTRDKMTMARFNQDFCH